MPLSPSMGSSTYVKDFVKSKNPKFKGKSKKKRISMALGAFYGAKREKKSNTGSDYPYRSANSRYEK
jgi:hypothetical protein